MATRIRAKGVAIATALASLVLAGCANAAVLQRSTTPEDALARIQGAAAKVTEARTARFSMVSSTTFAGEPVAAGTATIVGVYDYVAHKGQMDTTFKAAGIPERVTQRMLVIGSAVYMQMPEPPDQPDGAPPIPQEQHKPWVKFELPKEVADQSAFGPGLGLWAGDGPVDPTEALRYLKAASSKVEVVGEEQVRGEPTTRYAVTLDPAKQAAQLPAELAASFEEMGLTFPKPADVWIDRQGRLRKMRYAAAMKVPADAMPGEGASTQGAPTQGTPTQGTPTQGAPTQGAPTQGASDRVTVDSTLELYDFGVEVRVTPPPASQVEVMPSDFPQSCIDQNGGATPPSGSASGKQGTVQTGTSACTDHWASGTNSGSTTP
jgi:hypothetical protein